MRRKLSNHQRKQQQTKTIRLNQQKKYIEKLLQNTGLRYDFDYIDMNNKFYQSRQIKTIIHINYDDINVILNTYPPLNEVENKTNRTIQNFDLETLINDIDANNHDYKSDIAFDYQMLLKLKRLIELLLAKKATDEIESPEIVGLQKSNRLGYMPVIQSMLEEFKDFSQLENDPLINETELQINYNEIINRALNEIMFITILKNMPEY